MNNLHHELMRVLRNALGHERQCHTGGPVPRAHESELTALLTQLGRDDVKAALGELATIRKAAPCQHRELLKRACQPPHGWAPGLLGEMEASLAQPCQLEQGDASEHASIGRLVSRIVEADLMLSLSATLDEPVVYVAMIGLGAPQRGPSLIVALDAAVDIYRNGTGHDPMADERTKGGA